MSTFWKALDERITRKAMPDMEKITMKDDAELRCMHKKWMVEFERRYADAEEEERRFEIFKKTVEECERHNAKKKGYTFGLNQFSDLSPEELDAMCRPKLFPPWVYEKMREEEREKEALRYAREREALRYAGPSEDLTSFGCGGPY
ncbi:senescence-specific cysteine protease SAG39-like [Ananas comosus]|uniref:Senescence-specific cysteine protease SAG39-like n=1 Tax=Ananas comosus TaxID=4615 RepID=A0A6P5FNP3_ANACO|nr:senescence-specific cysteine protease SAG39-like [Ananas comosus]XP_020097927.1 senescence-specific cysteine protease SAG39-like [Ananas comosus]